MGFLDRRENRGGFDDRRRRGCSEFEGDRVGRVRVVRYGVRGGSVEI